MIAKRIHDRLPDYVSLDDLISTGVIGLLAAIDNFDPHSERAAQDLRRAPIRGAILDGLREMDWAPREVRSERSRLIEAAIHRAKQRFGREATEEEIAKELGITPCGVSGLAERDSGHRSQAVGVRLAGRPGVQSRRSFPTTKRTGPPTCWNAPSWSGSWRWPSEDAPMERTILNLYYYEELSLAEIAP